MLLDLKRLLNDTVIYGLGFALNRIGAILLLPLYTNYLTPAQYGTLEMFYVTSNVLTLFLAFGVEHATLRFYFEYDIQKDRNAVISTSAITSFLISIFILIIFGFFTDYFSVIVFGTSEYSIHFWIIFGIIVLSISEGIFYAYIRAIGKPVFYVIMSFLGLIFKVGFNYYFIVFKNLEVIGVLIGNLLGTTIIWIVLAVYTVKRVGISIHFTKLKQIYIYSFPLIAAGIFGMIMNSADRFFLKNFCDLKIVGIYALVIRLGTIIRYLYEQPFTKAYGPFRFEVMKNDNAKQLYGRVLSYYILGLGFIYLGLSFFTEFIVRFMAKDSYWPALPYLPFVALNIGLQGLYYHFQIGIYIKKNTVILWKIFFGATLINLIINYIFVPIIGIHGSIIASFLSINFINILTFFYSQKVFKINYEWDRIIKIAIIVAILMIMSKIINLNGFYDFNFKLFLLILYPITLYLSGFLTSEETNKLKLFKQRLLNKTN